MRLSLLQFQPRTGEIDSNLEKIDKAAADAAGLGSDLLVVPEYGVIGFTLSRMRELASPPGKGVFEKLGRIAREAGIGIIGATPSIVDDDLYNTGYVINSAGELVNIYHKIHLFMLMKEDDYFTGGNQTLNFEYQGVKSGFMICYDLRFPELARKLSLKPASLLFIPAYWPEPRLDHWSMLLRARAVENQMFVIGCNRAGRNSDPQFGKSAVIDPYGKVVAEAGKDEIMLTVDIDPADVEKARQALPFRASRRPDLYTA